MKDPMTQVAAQLLAALIASPAGREYQDAYVAWGTDASKIDAVVMLRKSLADEAFWLAYELQQARAQHKEDTGDEDFEAP
jgi:hypothetical protein